MFIIIMDSNSLIKKSIKKNRTLNYKGIHIYSNGEENYISLDKGYYFNDETKIKRLDPLCYVINVENYYYQIYVYVYENAVKHDSFAFYKSGDFIAASSRNADIYLEDPFLKDTYLLIKDYELKSNFRVYVNKKPYDGRKLKNGDLIEMLGFVFIYYQEFIYMNAFKCESKLETYTINRQCFCYPEKKALERYYLVKKYPELQIEELKEYKELENRVSNDIVKTIMPSVMMCLGMGIIAYINYINSYNSSMGYNSFLAYFVSLVTMIMSGVFLPLIFYLTEKRGFNKKSDANREEYLAYLKEYEEDLDKKVEHFIKANDSRYFSLHDLINDVFYLHCESEDFLTISLGKTVYKKKLEYKSCNDNTINQQYLKLSRKLQNIENYPFLYALRDNPVTTIISRKEKRQYFFERFLLEVAYKHHYDKVYIAIYSDDESLIDDYYDLPHLYFHSNRFFLSNEQQLLKLDQKKLDRPLVLFMNKHSNYVFHNPFIHVLYFSVDRKDLYLNSVNVIEYRNNEGLIQGETDGHFFYVEEDYDKERIFDRLRDYNRVFERKKPFSFIEIFKDYDIETNYQRKQEKLFADFAYSDDHLLTFDLHEKGQGPHGLIGGTTGSGKSELIVSMLLSLCIRYSPAYLNIVIIDYKGGGIVESLTSKGIKMPHIIGAVSNLEDNVIERMIIALNNECRRRQFLFKQLSAMTNTSIMNLDDYLNSEYKERIAHLLIVVDEFAELKKQNPEQIRALISISRIGRSLGIHLILATQKPSGNIDEEIFSNSHFKIALKVFEEKDSNDLIRVKDAAYLNEAGSFYLKVEDSLIKAQSIYAKKAINDNEPYEVSKLDPFLDKTGSNRKIKDFSLSQAAYYTDLINEITQKLELKIPHLKFMPPEMKKKDQINIKGKIVIGESDDYLNDRNEFLVYELNDNLLIYSDRKKEVNFLLNTFCENKRKTVFIGNEIVSCSCISDSLRYDEEEDIMYLLKYLLDNDDDLSVVIEDLNCFLSYNDGYSDLLSKLLRRSENLHFSFIFLTRSLQINFKLINGFKNRIMIGCSDRNDISYFFGSSSRYKGKSFYYDEEVKPFVAIKTEELITGKSIYEPLIRKIPQKIKAVINENGSLLGYDLNSRKEVYGNDGILITSYDEKLLALYKKAYPDLHIEIYDNSLVRKYKKDILFLGPGIFSQRLFISGERKDLNADEALYVHSGTICRLRRIDDA